MSSLSETGGARAGEILTITSTGDRGKSSLWVDVETGQLHSTIKTIRFQDKMVEITTTTKLITNPGNNFVGRTHPWVAVEKITKQEYFKRKLAGEIE